jgi:DNA mismatch repair protein MLH1
MTSAQSTEQANIRQLFRSTLADETVAIEGTTEEYACALSGWISKPSFGQKKATFILFINHRLVDSNRLKRAIENVYLNFLTKDAKPFVYLSMQIKPEHVDVNVHPAKSQVHFLHEEDIIAFVIHTIQAKLTLSSHSRTFQTQSLLTDHVQPVLLPVTSNALAAPIPQPVSKPMNVLSPPPPAHMLSRNSHLDRSLPEMFLMQRKSSFLDEEMLQTSNEQDQPNKRRRTDIQLTSVLQLRQNMLDAAHQELSEIIRNHVYVGEYEGKYAFFQCGTKLYMAMLAPVAQEYMYQLYLEHFSNFGRITIDPPIDVETLLGTASIDPKPILEHLVNHVEMLQEYFSMDFETTEQGRVMLKSLPLLLSDYVPNLLRLPAFLNRLVTSVDWTEEQACFHTFGTQLAWLYTPDNSTALDPSSNFGNMLRHTLFPSMKRNYHPSRDMASSGAILELSNLPELYKNFERC